MTFDTLAFCRRLEDAGVPPTQAEAHARAQVDFVVAHLLSEIATKSDLKDLPTKNDLKNFATKDDLKGFPTRDDPKGFATKNDLKGLATKDDLKGFPTMDDPKGFATKKDLELLGKTLTIRLGGMIALGIGALAVLTRL